MATMIEKTGKSVEEALQAALQELGVSAEEVEVEILERPSKKLFGILGSTPAKVQVKLKENSQPAKVEKVEEVPESPAEVEKHEEISEEKVSEPIEDVLTETENFDAEEPSDFDKTEMIDAAKKFLSEVFAAMKVDVQIAAEESDSSVVLDLSGKNLGILIGKHGQTLDSLQYLTNLAANRGDKPGRVHFILDVENYRARRADTLRKLAKSVADRAVRMRQDVKLEPMNRHERKVIHTALQDNDRVETRSAGEEPYRYIIVSPKRRGR